MCASQTKQPLATLVHISDLHFGKSLVNQETFFKNLLGKIPLVGGLYCHSYQAVRALAIRVNQILNNRSENNIPAGVVFTGDLTSTGQDEEFVVGSTFLRSKFYTGRKLVGLGLGVGRDEIDMNSKPALFLVPGNHDIWKRNNPSILASFLGHFPSSYPKTWRINTQDRPIFLHGISSIEGNNRHQKLARGYVKDEQLDNLDQEIGNVNLPDSIHIAFLHHPLIKFPKGWAAMGELDNRQIVASRLSGSVDLVLAGHAHNNIFIHKSVDLPNHAVVGTATQMHSDRNFLLIDVYRKEIELLFFDYGKAHQFVPRTPSKTVSL